MAISIGGGGKKSSEESETKRKGRSRQKTTRSGESKGKGRIVGKKLLRRLRNQAKKSKKLSSAGIDQSQENLNFADAIRDRALGVESTLRADNAAIVNAAQLRGEERLAEQSGALTAGAGSAFNSLVQANIAKGGVNLESQLAGLEGQLNLGASEAGTGAVNSALAGNLAAAQGAQAPFVNLAGILKGATQRQSSSQESLEDIFRRFTEETETEGSGSSSGIQGGIQF